MTGDWIGTYNFNVTLHNATCVGTHRCADLCCLLNVVVNVDLEMNLLIEEVEESFDVVGFIGIF